MTSLSPYSAFALLIASIGFLVFAIARSLYGM